MARQTTAVGIIDDSKRLLLVRRSPDSTVGPGLWQVPGGKLDPGETPEQAAVREVFEELGQAIDEKRLVRLSTHRADDLAHPGSPLTVHLFSYATLPGELVDVRLNEENQQYEWVDLRRPMTGRAMFGANAALVKVLWREANGIAALDAALARLSETDGMSMASDNASDAELSVLGVMGALGLVNRALRPTSPYASKVMEAIVSLSRADQPLFDDGPATWEQGLRLSEADLATLRESQATALASHRSLLTALTAKASLLQRACDVTALAVFGRLGERAHLLLWWDFFAREYRLVSCDVECVGKFVPTRVPLARFAASGFSAEGGVEGAMLRTHDVTVLCGKVDVGREDELLEEIRDHNDRTHLRLEYMAPEDLAQTDLGLGRLDWVPLDELLADPAHHDGQPVRGVAEVIDAAGKDELLRLAASGVRLG